MRHAIIGLIIGSLAGVIIGATIIGPHFENQISEVHKPLPASPAIRPPKMTDAAPLPARGIPETPKAPRTRDQPTELPPLLTNLRWRMASAFTGSLPGIGSQIRRIETEIKKISNSKFEIEFHEPGTLVPPLAMFEAVRSGTIQAAFSTPALWADKSPAFQLFSSIPFGPGPREYLAWFYGGGGRELFEGLYDKYDMHGLLCGMVSPGSSGWFKLPIQKIEDLKGLRMGIIGLGGKVMEKFGVIPEVLLNGDVYVALQSGAIDAAEFSQPATDFSLGLHQVANHIYFPGWHQPATFYDLMINKKSWDSLPGEAKAQIESVCGDNVRYGLAEADSRQFAALKKMTEMGIQIEVWPKEIMQSFQNAWADVAREQSRGDKNFKSIWKKIQEFREEYDIWNELSAP